jgi:hypothetical protein
LKGIVTVEQVIVVVAGTVAVAVVVVKEVLINSVLAVVASLENAVNQTSEAPVKLFAATSVVTISIFKLMAASCPVPVLDQPLLTTTVPRTTGVVALVLIVVVGTIDSKFSMGVMAEAAPARAARMNDFIVV